MKFIFILFAFLIICCSNHVLFKNTGHTRAAVSLKISIPDTSISSFGAIIYSRIKDDLIYSGIKHHFDFCSLYTGNQYIIKANIYNPGYLDSATIMSQLYERDVILNKYARVNDSIYYSTPHLSDGQLAAINIAINALTLPLGAFVYFDESNPRYPPMSSEDKNKIDKLLKLVIFYSATIYDPASHIVWSHDTSLSTIIYKFTNYNEQKMRLISTVQNDLRFKLPIPRK